jgi:transglutaminase-like putative cysteine protease
VGVIRLRLAVLLVGYVVLGAAAGAVFDQTTWVLAVAPCIPILLVGVGVGRPLLLRLVLAVVGVVGATSLAVAVSSGSSGDVAAAFSAGARRLLSTEWPSPHTGDLVGAVAAGLAIAAGTSALLSSSRRWHLLPLVPLLISYVAMIGLSAPRGAQPAVFVIECVVGVLFALLRSDGTVREQSLLLRGERRLVPLLAIAAFLAFALSVPIAFANRADPRRSEPASDTAALIDPIQNTVSLRALDPPTPLHEISSIGSDNAPLPTRWRTAALSSYDGRRWAPEIELRPIGSTLGPVTGPTVDVAISILDADLRFVPLPGDPVRVSAAVTTDPGRTVVRLVERPKVGDVVDLVSNVTVPASGSTGVSVAVRPVDANVASLTTFAQSLAGEGSLVDQLRAIEAKLHDTYVLDPATEGGGLQRVLIDRFLRDTQRGNREQFVTAFVLLARSLGVEARVAIGYQAKQPERNGKLPITSADAIVWPEIGLADGTWMPFDPVPASETTKTEPAPAPQVQTPAAPQPPIARPPEPPSDSKNADSTADSSTGSGESTVAIVATRSALAVALIAFPIVAALGLIILVKRHRRRRRLRSPDPTDRIRGAWAAATDDLVDAGLEFAPSSTDREIATSGELVAPDARRELHRLATLSGAATFGSPIHPELLSQDAATCLDSIDAAIGAQRTGWQRLRWRLSMRSLRKATRSPVQV